MRVERADARASRWCAVVLPALLLTGPALADTTEGSLRPYFELRFDRAPTPTGATLGTTTAGGGLLLGYGLSFSWTLTARYGVDVSPTLRASESTAQGVLTHEWTQQRHLWTVGAAWSYSDELTPVLMVEAGAAWRRQVDHRRTMAVDPFSDRRADVAAPTTEGAWVPAARAAVHYEWRFLDFWSVAAGPVVDYTGELSYGGQLWLAAYSYL